MASGAGTHQLPQHCTGRNDLSSLYPHPDRLEAADQTVPVIDADHGRPGDDPREADGAGGRREYRLPTGRGQVDPAMTGRPRLRTNDELADNPRTRAQGPLPTGLTDVIHRNRKTEHCAENQND